MNILFSIHDLAIESGGVTSAVCGLSESLAARGHRITIATLDTPGTPANPAGVAVKRFAPDRASKRGQSWGLNNFFKTQTFNFDIVHIHGIWQRHAYYAAHGSQKFGVPYLVAPHGMLDEASLRMGRRHLKKLAWWLLDGPIVRSAWAVHCLNEAEYRVAPWLKGLPKVIIGNGLPPDSLSTIPPRGQFRRSFPAYFSGDLFQRPVALFLSRIHPKKGLDRLLAHWKPALQKHPQLLLVIAGTGEAAYIDHLKSLCRHHGIDAGVLWASQLIGNAKWSALADADLFVLPSHQEGFSMAITEALGAACPVLITDECHFDEVRQHDTGIVIDGGDMQAYMQALDTLLADPVRRARMGANGRKLVQENFTWPRIAALTEDVYTRMIASR